MLKHEFVVKLKVPLVLPIMLCIMKRGALHKLTGANAIVNAISLA